MPRPKSHNDYEDTNTLEPGEALWHCDLLDEFIKKNPIPMTWGATAKSRYDWALWMVSFAADTSLLDKAYPDDHQLQTYYKTQIFARFAKEPDYFLALLSFTRKKIPAFSQIDKVAALLLEFQDPLPKTRAGELATDKEIANFFGNQPNLKLIGLHPSVIGKARKVLARRSEERAKGQLARSAETEDEYRRALLRYSEMLQTPEFKNWYNRKRKEQRAKLRKHRKMTANELLDYHAVPQGPGSKGDDFSFIVPANKNENLKSTFLTHFSFGYEYRPHEIPERTDENPKRGSHWIVEERKKRRGVRKAIHP